MHSPFPGMDPYLEHQALWPDVHNSLLAAIRDAMTPLVARRYFVALERRTYLLKSDDLVFVGRPDLSVVAERQPIYVTGASSVVDVLDVEVPMVDEIGENYLEIHEVKSGKLVTLLELLSPANKHSPEGRAQFLQKREEVLRTRTNLVELDLLRAGAPMPLAGRPVRSDYRILISRGWQRPRAQLYAFGVRQPMPTIPIPLQPEEPEPVLVLNTVFHELYGRARFDLRLDYTRPPVPPLGEEDASWATSLAPSSA
jgi:hypothetical protein